MSTLYAEPGDVQVLTPARRFGPQTTPSIEDVRRYCDMRSRELDALLADRGITVPVEDAAAVTRGWLRMVCAYGAAADAEAAGPNTGADTEGIHLKYLRGRWDGMVKMLMDGKVTLPDATRSETQTTGRVSMSASVGTAMFGIGDLYGGRLDGVPGAP